MKSKDELYKIIKKEEEINRENVVYKAGIRSPGRDHKCCYYIKWCRERTNAVKIWNWWF